MSKNITIQQDGTPINFSASMIETPLVGRGATDWQPEDEERMAKVLVRKNGTYNASSLSVPGIVEATVKLSKTGAAIEVTQRDVLGPVQPVNIAITEGDQAVNLTAKTLRIPGQSSGYERFLPALTGRVGEKTINREGTYKAANDGYYAWSKLTVNISDSGGGGGGGGGGGFDEPVDHIAVTTPPAKLQYADGEVLDYTGIVVTAYNAQNQVLGTIPYGELIFPVVVASGVGFTAVSNSILYYPCTLSENNGTRSPVRKVREGKTAAIISTNAHGDDHGGGWIGVYTISTDADGAMLEVLEQMRGTSYDIDGGTVYVVGTSTNEQYGGATMYTNPMGLPVTDEKIVNANSQLSTQDVYHLMDLLDFELTGGNVIPVQWERPEDGRLLESSFEIVITG